MQTEPAPRALASGYVLIPGSFVEPSETPDIWHSAEDDPWFLINGSLGSWTELAFTVKRSTLVRVLVEVDSGFGFDGRERISLPCRSDGRVHAILRLPERVVSLRVRLIGVKGLFHLRALTVRPLTTSQLLLHFLWPALSAICERPRVVIGLCRDFRERGLRAMKEWLVRSDFKYQTLDSIEYSAWVARFDTLAEEDRKAIRHHTELLSYRPRVSLILLARKANERWLRAAIESVRRQTYGDWELIVVDDGSSSFNARKVLEDSQRLDDRIRILRRESSGSTASAVNSALELARGEFVLRLGQHDELAEHALYMVAVAVDAHPNTVLIYSDEDGIDRDGVRGHPKFKPDWNLDLFYECDMLGHLVAYRTGVVRKLGGFRDGFPNCEDYDLALRVVGKIHPHLIRHIHHILYHERVADGLDQSRGRGVRESDEELTAARALQSHFDREGVAAEVVREVGGCRQVIFPLPKNPPVVSCIIPTRNRGRLLRRCLSSVRASSYRPIEVVVVDNQSDDRGTLSYFDELKADGVTVLPYDNPFNFSAICNLGARRATGEVLLFLNNDVEASGQEWLRKLVRYALRKEVGLVGCPLYYPDNTLQHGGGVLEVACAAHHGLPRGHGGYMGRAVVTQNLSVVSGACIMTRRDVFEEVGGFDERRLTMCFNDIDYCLRVREKGYLIVWTPHVWLYHLGSATLGGYGDSPDKLQRYTQEFAYMRHRWAEWYARDPYYNPNLSRESPGFQLAWPPRVVRPWDAVSARKSANADVTFVSASKHLLPRYMFPRTPDLRVKENLGC